MDVNPTTTTTTLFKGPRPEIDHADDEKPFVVASSANTVIDEHQSQWLAV